MNSRMSWSLILALSALVAGGCTAAATRVTIEPSPGRPEAQVRADGARCAEAASAVTTSLESVRTREYAACLLAQGYRITMPFRAGVEHARLTVSSPAGRLPAAIATDLASCQDAASAVHPSTADVVAGQYGGLFSMGDSSQVRPHTSESPELMNHLASCLRQRGYDAPG